ncbi:hypothetical protein GGQ86_003005 [Xanthobacter flavus]|uniref:Uncharacterized protein n=1 Tax=Xanthobacter flavus TaxID=281 RepID=A0ABU1KI59_XANFL|nr:hypothetical protein [Xanthobacter flavus]MDR6334523.1 hypothetical protein [Xanthobacter flavus]
MLFLTADNLGRYAVASVDRGPQPAGTGVGEDGQRGNRNAGREELGAWQSAGTLTGKIVERIGQDRAARNAPRETARAPAAGEVALKGRRRPNHQEGHVTIGMTRVFATILAGLARERPDRGESLLGYVEAEAGYLRDKMPGTADAMREACAEARRLRSRDRVAAE